MTVTLQELVAFSGTPVAIGRSVEATAWTEDGDLAIRFDAIDGSDAIVYLRGGAARLGADLGRADVHGWCPHELEVLAA